MGKGSIRPVLVLAVALVAALPAGARRGITASFVSLLPGADLTVRIQDRLVPLRLAGIAVPSCADDERAAIEAPLMGEGTTSPQGICRRAREHLTALLRRGEALSIVAERVTHDRDDALVAYVFRRRDGLMINEALVRQGLARARALVPGGPYEALLAAAEREALAARRGLWHIVKREE